MVGLSLDPHPGAMETLYVRTRPSSSGRVADHQAHAPRRSRLEFTSAAAQVLPTEDQGRLPVIVNSELDGRAQAKLKGQHAGTSVVITPLPSTRASTLLGNAGSAVLMMTGTF